MSPSFGKGHRPSLHEGDIQCSLGNPGSGLPTPLTSTSLPNRTQLPSPLLPLPPSGLALAKCFLLLLSLPPLPRLRV